jgi:16S rRNA (adenine1518-N6/adenine1519-N6)-dimethyltransferase
MASGPDLPIVEIGPGLGALTKPLLTAGATVLAVELDHGLAKALETWPEVLAGRLKVIPRDILTTRLADLGPGPFVVAGNLPYNLSTPILFWFLAQAPLAKAGIFMLQKEVAQRLVAKPGQDGYGRLAVALSLWTEAKIILEAPPWAFQPKPKVYSSVVILRPKTPPTVSLASLGRLTAAVFHARRKTLANNLLAAYGPEKTREVLENFGLPALVRAETLAPELLAELARYLEDGETELAVP